MDNKLESEACTSSALPPPKIGKRESEDEDKEHAVIAKKQKRDEVVEEQNNKEDINSNWSEQVKKPEAEPSEPATSCGSLDDGSSESDFGRSPDTDEENGEVDISKGECSEHCDEEAQKIKMEVLPVKDLKSSEYNEKEIVEKTSKTPHKRRETRVPLTRIYPPSKIIYVRNLSYSVERDDLENLFKGCGAVVDVRFNIDHEGKFRGFGHVEFGTAEAAQKALELDNTEVLRRRIKVGIAQPLEDDNAPNRSYWSRSFHKGETSQSHTVFAKGFGTSLVENKSETPAKANEKNAVSKTIHVGNLSFSVKRADVEKFFKNCGEIVDVRLHRDREGRLKGFGHVEFATAEAAQKALELKNTEFLKRRIYVDIAQERGDYTPSKSSSSSFHKDESSQSQTVLVKCFDPPIAEHKLTCAEEVKDMEMFDAASTEKEPETPATQKEKEAVPVKCFDTPIAEHKLTCAEEVKDMEMFDAASAAKEVPETPATQKEQKAVPVKCYDTPIVEHKSTCTEEVKDMEMFDASSAEKPETPATQKEKKAASTTIYVRNLSFGVERADIENIFKDCGEIVDVRLHVDVEFATAEAAEKALELDYTELLNHRKKVCITPKEGECFPNRSCSSNSSQKGERFQSLTVFVVGFDKSLEEEKIKDSLEEHFRSCGEITRISIPTYHGAIKGFAHLDFKDFVSYKNALQLDQTELRGFRLSVQKARPKPGHDDQGIGGCRGSGSYHFGGRDGGDHGGRGGWGHSQGIGSGRGGGGGGYHYGERDAGDHGGTVSWGDNHRINGGRGYHYGGRYGGDNGGRVGWGRSHGAWRY